MITGKMLHCRKCYIRRSTSDKVIFHIQEDLDIQGCT